jgi:hypothetical protein
MGLMGRVKNEKDGEGGAEKMEWEVGKKGRAGWGK